MANYNIFNVFMRDLMFCTDWSWIMGFWLLIFLFIFLYVTNATLLKAFVLVYFILLFTVIFGNILPLDDEFSSFLTDLTFFLSISIDYFANTSFLKAKFFKLLMNASIWKDWRGTMKSVLDGVSESNKQKQNDVINFVRVYFFLHVKTFSELYCLYYQN